MLKIMIKALEFAKEELQGSIDTTEQRDIFNSTIQTIQLTIESAEDGTLTAMNYNFPNGDIYVTAYEEGESLTEVIAGVDTTVLCEELADIEQALIQTRKGKPETPRF
ncbi:hypothetical protein AKH08_15605 [Vibrio parahaemolyticus]|nr:hypothetical protein AKH08_15605 [Vibrio parahaemolyticus]